MNRSLVRLVALVALAAASAALARQPLASPVYYLVTAPELVDGEPIDGELTTASGRNFKDGSYLDVLVLRSAGGETVDVRVESDDFDVVLTLVSPAGEILDVNDYVQPLGDAFDAARVRADLVDAGSYLVVVSGYGPSDLGRYTATRTRYLAPPQVVVDVDLPGRHQGYLNEGAADTLRVTLEVPATVRATLRSPDFDTVLEAYDARGGFLDANDDFDGTDSQLVLDLEAGRYEFVAMGFWEEATGAYTFEIEPYERPEPILVEVRAPGAFDGVLEPRAVHSYRLVLDAPATVTVDLVSSDFDTLLEAFEEADGTAYYLDGNDDAGAGTDSRLVLSLSPGAYLFDARGLWDDDGGAYTIAFDW